MSYKVGEIFHQLQGMVFSGGGSNSKSLIKTCPAGASLGLCHKEDNDHTLTTAPTSLSLYCPQILFFLLALTLEESEQHCELESMNQGEQNKTSFLFTTVELQDQGSDGRS